MVLDCPMERWTELPAIPHLSKSTERSCDISPPCSATRTETMVTQLTYVRRKDAPEEEWDYRTFLRMEGELTRRDAGGRLRTLDETGTGMRKGSPRPPDIPR